ncbi:MAG: peptidoglycan DD-metalloendopeptidase family protein [Firmicutes bacterium]|nr:peptidoglycan DD-metalloendopeptidase family protein [Bacillota bacterium]
MTNREELETINQPENRDCTECGISISDLQEKEDADTRVDEFVDQVKDKILAMKQKGVSLAAKAGNSCLEAFKAAGRFLNRTILEITPDEMEGIRKWGAARKAGFLRAEGKAEAAAARCVEALDTKGVCAEASLQKLLETGREKENAFFVWAENHKKPFAAGLCGGAAAVLTAALLVGHMTAYEYMYDGKVLGVVKEQNDVYETVELAGERLTYAYGANVCIDSEEDISFRRVWKSGRTLDSQDDILNAFTYLKNMNASAYAIVIDGKQTAIVDKRSTAKAILKEIQGQYLVESDTVEYKTVGFKEDVAVEEIKTRLGNIQSKEDAMEYLLTGAVEKDIYVVAQGETFSEIAQKNSLTQSQLKESNPGVDPNKLMVGQELVLNKVCPLTTVISTEVAAITEAIPYEISYEDTSALYKGETSVKLQGVDGQKNITAEISRVNGQETERTVLSEKIVSEPVNQIVLRGTKDKPLYVGSGTYVYPTRGRLSSGFGARWGRTHNGIDLATSTGTPIVAADGGKVTFAGRKGSFGNLVIINHGSGYETYYAHCSKLLVKAGDKVYQGQHIANVGSTGRSTGPHCHFEIRVNGKPRNPLNYL